MTNSTIDNSKYISTISENSTLNITKLQSFKTPSIYNRNRRGYSISIGDN